MSSSGRLHREHPHAHVGWMKKKGAGLLQGYKRRWFTLSGQYLSYHRSPEKEELGVLDLADACVYEDDGEEAGLVLEGPHLQRRYFLRCEDTHDRRVWFAHLRDAGTRCSDALTNMLDSSIAGMHSQNELPTAPVTADDFEMIRELGRGAFGSVQLASRKGGPETLYAIKTISKGSLVTAKDGGRNAHAPVPEIDLLTRLSNPFIVQLHHAYLTDTALCLVLEYLPGGELFKQMKRVGQFTEVRARFYAAEISSALNFLHLNNIVYRDLKPENCVLDAGGHVVLTDFGLAKCKVNDPPPGSRHNQPAPTFCGTPEYVAPEVLKGIPATKAVDWWSWGVLLYEMVTGSLPFHSDHPAKLYNLILTQSPNYDLEYLSAECIDLLQRVLDRAYTTRLQSQEELEASGFFADLDWRALHDKRLSPPEPIDDSPKTSLDIPSPVDQSSVSGSPADPFSNFSWKDTNNVMGSLRDEGLYGAFDA